MYPAVRPQAKYDRSVELLKRTKDAGLVAKTGIMVGIGERDEEVLELMDEVVERSGVRHPDDWSVPPADAEPSADRPLC